MSEDYEKEGLAEPFKGITTNGEVMPGLFEIKPTGVSTEPVRNAAAAFIDTLTPRAIGENHVSGGRHRVAQMDEPALLRAPGHLLRGNDATASAKPRSA